MPKTIVTHINKPHDVFIGRPSLFGNPFPITDTDSRSSVIAKYRKYFHQRIAEEPDFQAATLALKGKRLACFCFPLKCHGDVIVEWLESQK